MQIFFKFFLILFCHKKNNSQSFYNENVIHLTALIFCQNQMYTIKKITANDTISVRHPVLRNGKPIESCHFDGDTLPSTHHFGIFIAKKLIGVISLFKSQHSFFQAENQIQIRGMAVLEEFQRKGLGKMLIRHCEQQLKDEADCLLWFNARENAGPFYEKLGYTISGTSFEIEDVGTHFVMYKYV